VDQGSAQGGYRGVVARRRVQLLVAAGALAAVALVVVLVLLLRGGDGDRSAQATSEPLAYVPAGAAEVVFDVDTREPLIGLAVEQLAPRVTDGALTADQVHALLGGRAAIATGGGKAWLAFATNAPAPTPSKGAATAHDGVVVFASNAADLQAALKSADSSAAEYARATFDKRFDGLPQGSSARVGFRPQPLLASRSPEIANTRWAKSLRAGAAVLATEGNVVRVPFKIEADPVGLTPADLPIATGAQPPSARGSGPLIAGIRNPAQTLKFVRTAGLLQELNLVDQLPGFLKPDLGNLGPNGTLTSASLDFSHITLRTEPPDPGDWSSKLGRLDALSGIARRTGITDIDIAHKDGVYTLTENGNLVARIGIFGRALVLSNDPNAELQAAANAPASPTPPGAAGALTLRARPTAFFGDLPDLISGRIGDVTGWARAELTGVTGELQLAVG
jgi:hypothetical protein